MTMHFSAIAEKALADGTICAKDVLDLRRTGWADGTITAEEAATIFAVNRRLATPEPEWAEFFREAITHFIVEIEEPRGYVSEANARWLIDQIEADGAVCSLTELETLIRVFETALSTPETLRVWAIECLEREVLTGEGPTRCGGELEKGRVTQAEAALLVIDAAYSEYVSKNDYEAGIEMVATTDNTVMTRTFSWYGVWHVSN